MSKNVAWTKAVEEEFRNRSVFTEREDAVFTLHMPPYSLTQAEIAERLNISLSAAHRALKSVKDKYKLAYLESDTLPPFLENSKDVTKWQEERISNDYELSRSELCYLIDEWIFNELHRNILKRRLLDGIPFERLSEEFNMSVRQIKSIVYTAQDKLYDHI